MIFSIKVALLLTVIAVFPYTPRAQTPPSNVWCQYVVLPQTVPFSIPQPIWWQEYFLFNPIVNQTVEFKIYAGIQSDAHISMLVGTNYCPVFIDAKSDPHDYEYGTTNITVDVVVGNSYLVFAHMSGGNYTVVGCAGACPEYCPNDCSRGNGVCNLNSSQCVCADTWTGNNCSLPVTNTTHNNGTSNGTVIHKKVPFGNLKIFYSVVIVVPTIVVLSLVIGVALFAMHKRNAARKKSLPVRQPLLVQQQDDNDSDAGILPQSGSHQYGNRIYAHDRNGHGETDLNGFEYPHGINGAAHGTNGTNGQGSITYDNPS